MPGHSSTALSGNLHKAVASAGLQPATATCRRHLSTLQSMLIKPADLRRRQVLTAHTIFPCTVKGLGSSYSCRQHSNISHPPTVSVTNRANTAFTAQTTGTNKHITEAMGDKRLGEVKCFSYIMDLQKIHGLQCFLKIYTSICFRNSKVM